MLSSFSELKLTGYQESDERKEREKWWGAAEFLLKKDKKIFFEKRLKGKGISQRGESNKA